MVRLDRRGQTTRAHQGQDRKAALLVSTVPTTLAAFWIPLVRHLRARGWRVDAMAAKISRDEVAVQFDSVIDVPWSRSPVRSLFMIPVALHRLRRALAHGGHSLVQVQTPIAGFITRLAARSIPRSQRPVVIYSVHGFHSHPLGRSASNKAVQVLEGLAARWTDFIIVTNEYDRRQAARLNYPADKVLHIPGVGIDVSYFARKAVPSTAVEAVFPALDLPDGTPFVLCVAEFNRNKRQEHLVRALSQMQRTDVHLVLRGSGPRESTIRSVAAELGVAERVRYAPFQADLRPLIVASRALALVSRREGLPVSIMEALSLEVPAVGTDIRGIRDLLDDGRGSIVPIDDVGALARALDAIVAGHPGDPSFRLAAREYVAEHHRIEIILDSYSDLYARAHRLSVRTHAGCGDVA